MIPGPLRAALDRVPRDRMRRRQHQLVILFWVSAMLMVLAMVIGPWLNDRTIAADRGQAYATVTDAGWWRTTVEYRDESGRLRAPRGGVLYPGNLATGSGVWVDYQRGNPDLVKVSGRNFSHALPPALATATVASALAAAAWWLIGIPDRRRTRREGGTQGG
ncbi:DUF3592 domain-containing protein [Corynebacterium pygosceleis]|uniref:DUF3592 domain-containing protein n=1 Tax=Corynebacterium pygosceleis TaxID=2800406 RepID=A0A9Q4C762_9CORY|nr:DUF3592 domain-containing protein [Corynebacterium pygosceleis]MCK7637465.1 DUF3592 domain-containing protein [Corynebacterium pygosceleis]MCK7674652.1 DUF3592 domain-containing protein [Corynebacterium pygosceleis]MCL0119759.1 DUF3592 domain-containing protein [Corynebacterium pygosceleis]MCX7445006.1 DUF3592 domain-containing protein [Corynebacterium pygosceleis]MCX7468206.1 DUF3592 domain-containing protein [Corynebacterium pygosceleis]